MTKYSHPMRSYARCLLVASLLCTSLAGCAKIKPYLPVTASEKRAKLPATGITPIQAISITKGDTERLKTPNRVVTWFNTVVQKNVPPAPPGTRYTFKAESSLRYSKEQLHVLLQCKAHAFQYEQQFTKMLEEEFVYDASASSDYAQAIMLVRYEQERGKPLPPQTDPRCMSAPTEALPATAIAPVQSQALPVPVR